MPIVNHNGRESFVAELWETDPTSPQYNQHTRNHTLIEIADAAKDKLKRTPYTDEWQSASNLYEQIEWLSHCDDRNRWDGQPPQELPTYRQIICFCVEGASEGHIIRLAYLAFEPASPNDGQMKPIFSIKTLCGADVALKITDTLTRFFVLYN